MAALLLTRRNTIDSISFLLKMSNWKTCPTTTVWQHIITSIWGHKSIILWIDLRYGWLIRTPNKSFAVYAATATEKVEWMAHINKCVEELINRSIQSLLKYNNIKMLFFKRKTARWLNTQQFGCLTAPPLFACIAVNLISMSSTDGYLLYSHIDCKLIWIVCQHHSRNCGDVVCGQCSKNKFLIPNQSSKPVRVCNASYEKLGKLWTSLRDSSLNNCETEVKGLDKMVVFNVKTIPIT